MGGDTGHKDPVSAVGAALPCAGHAASAIPRTRGLGFELPTDCSGGTMPGPDSPDARRRFGSPLGTGKGDAHLEHGFFWPGMQADSREPA